VLYKTKFKLPMQFYWLLQQSIIIIIILLIVIVSILLILKVADDILWKAIGVLSG
jgi:hypothetical protein